MQPSPKSRKTVEQGRDHLVAYTFNSFVDPDPVPDISGTEDVGPEPYMAGTGAVNPETMVYMV